MVTFVPYPQNILRAYYKTVYIGRIIAYNENQFEYREKNDVLYAHLQPDIFSSINEAKNFVIDSWKERELSNKRVLSSTIDCLTDKGRNFIKRFIEKNKFVNSKQLTREERSVADHFILHGLLEKKFETSVKDMLYYTNEPERKKILKKLNKK